MKIILQEEAGRQEIEITLTHGGQDSQLQALLALLHGLDQKLHGQREGQVHLFDLGEVYYFDTVDKKTFAYTAAEVFEVSQKLYELETLAPALLLRVSKSAVLNLEKVKSLKPDFGGRLTVTLENGEKLSVSRQYAGEFKARIGI